MFVEVLQAASALDFSFFLDLITGNLFWLFALGVYAYFSGSSKSWLWNFIAVTLMIYAWVDLSVYLGWSFDPEGFLPLVVYSFLVSMALGILTNGFAFMGRHAKYSAYIVFGALFIAGNLSGVLF